MDCDEICFRHSSSEWVNSNDFGDPKTFSPVQPAGQSFHLFSEISQDLLDGFAPNFVKVFILLTLVIGSWISL